MGETSPSSYSASPPETLGTFERWRGTVAAAFMAGQFLWCWAAPTAIRPALAFDLFVAFALEVWLGGFGLVELQAEAGVRQSQSRGGLAAMRVVLRNPGVVAFALMMPLVVYALAWPNLLFVAWLLADRVMMLADGRRHNRGTAREQFWLVMQCVFWLLAIVLAALVPLPALGFAGPFSDYGMLWKDARGYVYSGIAPQQAMAAGLIYYGFLALLRAYERPAWWHLIRSVG